MIIHVTEADLNPKQKFCPIKTAIMRQLGIWSMSCWATYYSIGIRYAHTFKIRIPTPEMVEFMKQWDKTHSNVEPFDFDFDSLPLPLINSIP